MSEAARERNRGADDEPAGGSTREVEEAMARAPVEDARWRPAAAPLAFWAVVLGALAGLQAAFGGRSLPVLVQATAAGLIGLIALTILLGQLVVRSRAAGLRTVPDLSLASALVAISLTAAVAGATVGTWLVLGGFLGLVLGTGGLIREHRAERRTRRASAVATQSRAPARASGNPRR